jgi:hypothetical protein
LQGHRDAQVDRQRDSSLLADHPSMIILIIFYRMND